MRYVTVRMIGHEKRDETSKVYGQGIRATASGIRNSVELYACKIYKEGKRYKEGMERRTKLRRRELTGQRINRGILCVLR